MKEHPADKRDRLEKAGVDQAVDALDRVID
jgi:hypothetical protein